MKQWLLDLLSYLRNEAGPDQGIYYEMGWEDAIDRVREEVEEYDE